MKKTYLTILVVAILGITSSKGYAQAPNGYSLVWAEEFNEPRNADGALPLPGDKWWFETGGHGWGNNELQYYVDRTAARDTVAKIEDGHLIITAIKRAKPYYGKNYISARMNTVDSWKYGYFEARAKVPGGKGTWSAFWMMPQNYTAWPDDGEIDIMEYVGYRPNVTQSSIHTAAYNHKDHTEKTATKDILNAESEFHTYGLEWTEDYITGYVDGVAYFTFQNDHTNNKRTWPFNEPFYLKLNLAIGGDWGGLEGVDESIFPAKYEVDYVRVYQKSESGIEGSKEDNKIGVNFNRESKTISLDLNGNNISEYQIIDLTGRVWLSEIINQASSLYNVNYASLDKNKMYILTLKGRNIKESHKFVN